MNPFEMRAEMLKMAQDYLQTEFDAAVKFQTQMFEAAVKLGKAMTQEQLEAFAPKMYSFEDITKKAMELYNFVKDPK